jgi:hypothetical protein
MLSDSGAKIFNTFENHQKEFTETYNSAKPFLDKFEQLGYKISIVPNPKEI